MAESIRLDHKISEEESIKQKLGYNQTFYLSIILFCVGTSLEVLGITFSYDFLSWPNNAILGISLVVLLTTFFFLFRKSLLVKWLGGAKVTIVSLLFLGVLTMIMGILPQMPEASPGFVSKVGFNRVTSSWAFIFSMLLFIINLWFGTLKKLIPFQLKNFGFFLNHSGLFVAVMAGFLGVGDLQRLTMQLHEGETNWVAVNDKGMQLELPVAMTLNDFAIDQYQPKFGLANNETGKLFPGMKPQLTLIEEVGVKSTIADWKIEVTDYLPDAMPYGEDFHQFNDEGSAPAAQVKVIHTSTGEVKSGWISSGSFMSMPASLELDSTYSVVMTAPEPKKFSSDVMIYEQGGEKLQTVLEVNKPVSIAGWDIYQLSYDERFGKWSRSSTVELVRDPWIVVVYIGIYMMLAGAIYTLWKGRNLITKQN